MRFHVVCFSLLLAIGAVSASGQERYVVTFESGPAWQLRNDFAVPGDTGTLVRLEERESTLAHRVTFSWRVGERWSVRFLAAPLSTETTFTPSEAVRFQDETFAAGTPVDVDYRFDSYRVSAVRHFSSGGPWSFRAGVTLKVRDAEIALRNPTRQASKSNTGVVPLLYGGVRLQATPRIAIDADVDAAGASQGRAVDAAVRLEGKLNERWSLYAGTRLLDGGADNDEVNSFATFAYGFGGVRVAW